MPNADLPRPNAATPSLEARISRNQQETWQRLIMPADDKAGTSPLVVSSPHSGRVYPASFLDQAQLPLASLRLVEDCGLDILLGCNPMPAPVLLAEFPRCFVDLNRHADDLDDAMFSGFTKATTSRWICSHYQRAGLGVIPARAFNQQLIYDGQLEAAEVEWRLGQFYHPWHASLADLLEQARHNSSMQQDSSAGGGQALLLDIHSMPSSLHDLAADIILGNRHGATTEPWLLDAAMAFFMREGLVVKCNSPFAGGHITRHYGKPEAGVMALQIEINRQLYLDEQQLILKPGWHELATILNRFCRRMDEVMRRHQPASR